MTGPVERVPLTEEQLDEWERNRDYICFDQHHWDLIAELRASRAREQELHQRIEEVSSTLALDSDEPLNPPAPGVEGRVVAYMNGWDDAVDTCRRRVRDALTGTETRNAHLPELRGAADQPEQRR